MASWKSQNNEYIRERRISSIQSDQKSRSMSKQLGILNKDMENYQQQSQSGKNLQTDKEIGQINYRQIIEILRKSPEQRTKDEVIFLVNELNILEFFRNINFDDNIKQKYKLVKYMRIEQFNSNNGLIYQEGCSQKKFYVVLRGKVKVVQRRQLPLQIKGMIEGTEKLDSLIDSSEDLYRSQSVQNNKEQEVVLKVFQAGQYFGETELIFHSKRFCSALSLHKDIEGVQEQYGTLIGVFCQNTFINLILEFVKKQNPFYSSLSLLQLVPKEGKIKLCYLSQRKQFAHNEFVYKQNQKVDYVYYLDKGSIELKIQQKKILDALPHSIQQKKEDTQILCSIPEKSFIGDEDLLNLTGNRQYSAVVSSINAVLFYVDATVLFREIQEVYGSLKANQMISSYLLSKQKWRNSFIESANQVKKKYPGFSSSPSKINQNLVEKKKTQSKQDLLTFATNALGEIEGSSKLELKSVAKRCKTENNNYSTIDASTYLNTDHTCANLNEDISFQMNQNHLKLKKNKFDTQNPLNLSQLNQLDTQKHLLEYCSQNNFFKQTPNENQSLKEQKSYQMQKKNGGKYKTIECDKNGASDVLLSMNDNLLNQGNSRLRRCESITLQEKQGQSTIFSASVSENQFYRHQSPDQVSSTLSPCNHNTNQGTFKIQLNKIEDEKNHQYEFNQQTGNISNLQFPKQGLLSQSNTLGSQKIYDPFNNCWVKKTYPLMNINKMKNQLNAIRAFKSTIKYQQQGISQYSPKSQLKKVNSNLFSDFQQSNQFQKNNSPFNNEDNSENISKFNLQQDLKLSTILGNGPIKERIPSAKQGQGQYNSAWQAASLFREQSDQLNSLISFAPILKNQSSFSQHSLDKAFLNKINQNDQINSVQNNVNKNQEKMSNCQNHINNDQETLELKLQHTEIKGNKNVKNIKTSENKQMIKDKKSLSSHNNPCQQKVMGQQQDRVRNNSSDSKTESRIDHLNQRSKGNRICKEELTNSLECKSNYLRRLRKVSVEQCRNEDELVNQYLNKFIQDNCNGNEIYQIESSNLIGKKKLLLKDLLNQIGSSTLNCININEDQKNTKYDFLLKGLEKKRKRNHDERVPHSSSSSRNYKTIEGENSHLSNNHNKVLSSMMVASNIISTIRKNQQVYLNNKEFASPQQKDQVQYSKILQNIVSSYNKKKDQDCLKSDFNQCSIDNVLNELSLNHFQAVATPILTISSKSNILGSRAVAKSYNIFKQKQEMKKKLKPQPLNRSYNGSNLAEQKFDIQKLHQTLFVFTKDHSASQALYLE